MDGVVLGGFLLLGCFGVAFDEFVFGEGGSGADERHKVWRVDGPPPGLCSLHEFECHRYSCGPRSWSFGDALPESHGRKGRLDRVRGPQMDPVLGRVVIEREEHINVVGDLRRRFGPLGPIGDLERLHTLECVVFVLGLPDLGQRGPRARLGRFGQAVENVRRFVKLMPTSA